MSVLLRLATGFVAVTSLASASLELGHGRIEASAAGSADFDSNIYANSSSVSDEVFTVTPEVHYIRDKSIFTADLALGVSLVRFLDHTSQNSENPYFSGRVAYAPSDKTLFNSSLNISRTAQADETLNARVTANNYNYSGLFQYLFSEKLGYRLTAGYGLEDYLTSGYSDVYTYSVGADAVYVYSPKLTFLTGFTYGQSRTADRSTGHGNPASQDFGYHVGVEGEVAPKVTGSISVGVTDRTFDNGGFSDSSTLSMSAGLKWAATQKTTFSLDASNGFGTTAGDQSSKNLNINLGVQQALSEKMSLDGSIGYEHSNYTSSGVVPFTVPARIDDAEVGLIRLNYSFTANVSGNISVGYRYVESSLNTSTYDRFNCGVGVTVRF